MNGAIDAAIKCLQDGARGSITAAEALMKPLSLRPIKVSHMHATIMNTWVLPALSEW
jgi:hypothetical protein